MHTYTHAHTGTHPRTYCIIHTKRSTLALRTNAAAWELPVGQSMKGWWKCLFSFTRVNLHTPSPTSRSRIQGWDCGNTHRLKRIRVCVCVCLLLQIFTNKASIVSAQARCTICHFLSADLCVCACGGEANRACWRCTAARWLWWGEPLCSATPPAAAGCSAWGSVPRPAAPLCPLSPERHGHTTETKAVAQIAVAGTGEERQVQRWL